MAYSITERKLAVLKRDPMQYKRLYVTKEEKEGFDASDLIADFALNPEKCKEAYVEEMECPCDENTKRYLQRLVYNLTEIMRKYEEITTEQLKAAQDSAARLYDLEESYLEASDKYSDYFHYLVMASNKIILKKEDKKRIVDKALTLKAILYNLIKIGSWDEEFRVPAIKGVLSNLIGHEKDENGDLFCTARIDSDFELYINPTLCFSITLNNKKEGTRNTEVINFTPHLIEIDHERKEIAFTQFSLCDSILSYSKEFKHSENYYRAGFMGLLRDHFKAFQDSGGGYERICGYKLKLTILTLEDRIHYEFEVSDDTVEKAKADTTALIFDLRFHHHSKKYGLPAPFLRKEEKL